MISLFLMLAAQAGEAAPDDEADAPIVVTASRSGDGVPADRLGGSVTLLDDRVIADRQVRDISDILRDVPGVAVSRVPGSTQVRLRGAEANHTLVLIDGIEVSDPFAGEFDFGTLIADEGARIEVLRGQQSALYGSDAIGGVVHYITLTGREAPGARLRVEGGSFDSVNAAARVAGVSGALDYALSGSLISTDGAPNARGGTRDLASDSGALSAKTTLALAPNARLSAVVRYARTDAAFNGTDNDPASPTFGFTVDTPGARFENEALYGLVRGELDLLDGRWTHALSGQFADTTRDNFDADGRDFGSEGQRLKGSYETTIRFATGGLDHRLTGAIDLERERFRNTDPSGVAFTGRRSTENLGLVAQYDLTGDRWALGAALRHDENDRFADTTTWRAQGSVKVGAATRLRAAAGSGVKNPTFYELFGFFDGRFIGNPDLRPEKSEGFELGAEQGFAGDRVLLGATYFDNRLKSEIFTDFPPPDFVPSPGNRESVSKQRGVELFGRARLGASWRVDASYSYTRSREAGEEEVRRPPHIASLAVDWRAGDKRSGVNLVARYNGATDDSAFIDPSFVPVRVRLSDFVLVNLAGDLALTERIALFARVENLLDEDYEQIFSFTNPGRAAYIGARARF